MENASKALIIAGAILLAILLISLGILIFNQAQDTVNNSGMTEAEITSFNNKFLKYEGDKQKGSVAKSLINEVIATNADTSLPADQHVKIIQDSGAAAEPTSSSWIKTDSTYKIEITKYSKEGRANEITITKN